MKRPSYNVVRRVVPAAVLIAASACGATGEAAQFADPATSHREDAMAYLPVPGDLGLLDTVASSALGQVDINTLATKRTNSPLVREYAQFMTNYANQWVMRAQNIANQKHVSVEPVIGIRDHFHYGRLQYRYGAYFDTKFISYQNADAERALSAVQEGLSKTLDPDVRTFAQQAIEEMPDIIVLIKSVDLYRGSPSDFEGQFDHLLRQTRLGQSGGKGKWPVPAQAPNLPQPKTLQPASASK